MALGAEGFDREADGWVAVADDGSSPGVVRVSFRTRDIDEAEEFLSRAYTRVSMSVPEDRGEAEFRHDTAATAQFSISRFSTTVTYTAPAAPMAGLWVISPRTPSPILMDSRSFDAAPAADGVAAMVPAGCDFTVDVRRGADFDLVGLDTDALADYVKAVVGLPADELRATGLAPIAPAKNELLRSTIAHIRNDVLGNPFAASSPVILDSAFRTLAAAMLTTYPNSALEAATDPEGRAVRGDVPEARLREIIDFIHAHADRPIGPAGLSEIAGVPAREVVEGLRRHRGVHPAELLWWARMQGVHRDLSGSDPAGTSVAALAARWGFSHLARFAVAYTRLFDERPEDTLQR